MGSGHWAHGLDIDEGLVFFLVGLESDHGVQVALVGQVEVRIRDHQRQVYTSQSNVKWPLRWLTRTRQMEYSRLQ